MQRPNRSEFGAAHRLPLVGPAAAKPGSHLSRNLKIRDPPVDDVNNLGHDSKCQRCLASTAIQIRRNALFTSPEYAMHRSAAVSTLPKRLQAAKFEFWLSYATRRMISGTARFGSRTINA